jgi:hypothetical protein
MQLGFVVLSSVEIFRIKLYYRVCILSIKSVKAKRVWYPQANFLQTCLVPT